MLQRKAYKKLKDWKSAENRKALCIIGARQIGKTTLVREFAKENYKCFVEINFLIEQDAKRIFDGNLDPSTLITNITAFKGVSLVPGDTLILFDEIQECPNARMAIKFLVEDGRFDYIETGSQLGVRYREVKSYPVGFEEIYYMFPMDFEEFALANGASESILKELKKCLEDEKPVDQFIHERMLKLFYLYIAIGGMPEAVQVYVNTHDLGAVKAVQQDIVNLYRLDIAKYAGGSEKIKIRDIFDSIPAQLDDKNRRFMVNSLAKTARMNRYDESFRWLADAGVALPCYNLEAPKIPLKLNEKHSLFKLFMNDTGLLCAMSLGNAQFEVIQGNLEINMGSILENAVAQQLKCNGFDLYYFDSSKQGEVDFAVENFSKSGSEVSLIEVKSGNDFKHHKALDNILEIKDWHISHAIVACKSNLERRGKILYLPWYLLMFYRPPQLTQQLVYGSDFSQIG